MKKQILGAIAALFFFSGSASAVVIDTIGGFGPGDRYEAQSNPALTTTFLNGVLRVVTADTEQTLDQTDPFFFHEYIFTAIADSFLVVAATVENILGGNTIDDFYMAVQRLDTFAFIAEDIIPVSTTSAEASIAFAMLAGTNYRIVLSGSANDPGPDYKLELSQVPVPAAVWLFGTALLGLFGLRRKGKLEVAA
ncbi:MAG: VPLPA-CTERM sorting domain-containing protein [Gammaproteobacteria bacterium]|nr:VPLPA-CTERM sorting domain-containing protein [Gammaproteobacteria bacterium]